MQRVSLGITPAIVVAEHKASADLETFCRDLQIPFVRLEPLKDRDSFDEAITRHCSAAHLNLLCLTFDKRIPPSLVSHYRGHIINVHMGLLPAFPGLRALDQAIAANVRFLGATIHEVDEELDHGAIVAQCVLGLRRGETAESAGNRLFGTLRLMYLQVIAWFARGRVEKDEHGQIWIKDGVYGELPTSPSVEQSFAD